MGCIGERNENVRHFVYTLKQSVTIKQEGMETFPHLRFITLSLQLQISFL